MQMATWDNKGDATQVYLLIGFEEEVQLALSVLFALVILCLIVFR
jgi:hypothetical protein